jgi:hypothetical protein
MGSDDGWRFHVGARTRAERRLLLRFMTRRSVWSMYRHGWRATLPGRVTAGAFVAGLPLAVALVYTGMPTALAATAPLLLAALTIVVILPVAVLISTGIRWWRLRAPHSAWVAHWCEGPDGQLAVRMTKSKPPLPGQPTQWPGIDLFGQGGAGRRLLEWLQRLADDQHATLIIKTNTRPLIGYYEHAGFTLIKSLRPGRAAVLQYPAPEPADSDPPARASAPTPRPTPG